MKRFVFYLKLFAELGKVKVTVTVTLTTILGFVLFSHQFSTNIIAPALGIFILACASSALNHYQEYRFDAMMERTKNRPIPANKVTPANVLLFSIFFAVTGSLILYFFSGLSCLLLGLMALLWYNGIYTPLKRKTAFAVIPGSIIGAIPPLIGWKAAGGDLLDFRIILVAFFYFIWQIPHFWLLLLKYGEDYKKAGYPVLQDIFSDRVIKNITFVWIVAMVVTGLQFPFFKVTHSLITTYFICGISILTLLFFSNIISIESKEKNFKVKFILINVYMLLLFLSVTIDAVV